MKQPVKIITYMRNNKLYILGRPKFSRYDFDPHIYVQSFTINELKSLKHITIPINLDNGNTIYHKIDSKHILSSIKIL